MFTHVHNATSLVVLLSSTLNPFIYGLWGKHFQVAVKSALCCNENTSRNTTTHQIFIVDIHTASGDVPKTKEDNTRKADFGQ